MPIWTGLTLWRALPRRWLATGAIVAGLLAALLVQSGRLSAEQRAHAETRAAWATDRADQQTSAAHAMAAAVAAKTRKDDAHVQAADAAAQRHADLARQYRSMLSDRRMRGPTKADSGSAAPGDLPGDADPASLSENTASRSRLSDPGILISASDALICAETTAYAQAAHVWAMELAQAQ